jgi:hypothetical protein
MLLLAAGTQVDEGKHSHRIDGNERWFAAALPYHQASRQCHHEHCSSDRDEAAALGLTPRARARARAREGLFCYFTGMSIPYLTIPYIPISYLSIPYFPISWLSIG